ncbi:hypothetical protein ACLB2K_053847 [Fragaria x ananassa]
MVQRLYPKRCRSSLAETVANLEELLTEILLRVPAKPLLRFKCVSKHWLSLISDPKFRHRHTLQNPNSPISAVFPDRSTDFSFIPFPPDHNHISARWNPLEVIANQYGDDIYIMHSCNGLILCRPLGAPSVTKYKYIRLRLEVGGISILLSTGKILSATNGGVYCNGAIHWVGSYSDMSYFHIDEERVGFVESTLPCYQTLHSYEKKWYEREYRYFMESSGGLLHLIDIYKPFLTNFEVLEMGRDYSGWFVKYHVDLYPLCTAFPNLPYGEFVVLFLDRDENEEDGGLSLLLHSPGNVISCNLKSKTFKSFELTTDERLLVDHHNFMYKETLACV